MSVFFWGIFTPLLAFLVQLIWWRIRLPRYQTKTAIAIFLATLAAVLAGLMICGSASPLIPRSPWQYLHIALMHMALLCAWVITYSALEADSPTLVMVARLLKAGSDGVREADLVASMADEVLLVPRVQDLIRDKMATMDESGRYRLTSKGHLFLKMVYGYRGLTGASIGG